MQSRSEKQTKSRRQCCGDGNANLTLMRIHPNSFLSGFYARRRLTLVVPSSLSLSVITRGFGPVGSAFCDLQGSRHSISGTLNFLSILLLTTKVYQYIYLFTLLISHA